MKSIKSINGLMKYLRDHHKINIKGTSDKQHLKSVGYFHGYKGYRYIKKPSNKLSFNSFNEIMAIIDFDNKLKSLLYSQVMFIETAIKSYALEIILQEGKTENFSDIYTNLMTDYKSYSSQSSGGNHPFYHTLFLVCPWHFHFVSILYIVGCEFKSQREYP